MGLLDELCVEVSSPDLRVLDRVRVEELPDAEAHELILRHSDSLHMAAFPFLPTCSTVAFSTRPYFLSLSRVL